MRLYITATYKGTANRAEVEHLCDLVAQSGWEDFCFIRDVENWQTVFDDPRDLMARSLETVQDCDALLIDLTHKPTGRAYETGMAYALGKRVIVIMQRDTAVKDTTRGIAAAIITYNQIDEIGGPLADLHRQWTPTNSGS
ncbi:nucleoside 2-deoxyribosyltransferase [Chloroflexota bacterium]